jgi:ribosomal protein L37AE/L43A
VNEVVSHHKKYCPECGHRTLHDYDEEEDLWYCMECGEPYSEECD